MLKGQGPGPRDERRGWGVCKGELGGNSGSQQEDGAWKGRPGRGGNHAPGLKNLKKIAKSHRSKVRDQSWKIRFNAINLRQIMKSKRLPSQGTLAALKR